MPERFSLYPDLTVKENLEFFASLFGVRVKDNYDLIAPVMAQLEKFPNRRASALSGGMKQKLALGCALIHRPKVLLLDEPTTGVDAISRSEFWTMLRSLRESGITILVSTSYMDEAVLCEAMALIYNGTIVEKGTPSELTCKIGKKYFIHIKTELGSDTLEADNIENTLLSLLGEMKRNGIKVLDIKVDRGTLEQHFMEMTGRAEK